MKLIVDISEYDYEYICNAYSIPQDINAKMAESIIFAKTLPQHREMFVGDRDRREVMLGKAYLKGWNDCIDKITGEAE